MKNVLEDIKSLILSSKKIILAGHQDPDGDTLGSMLALHLILKKMGIDSQMFSTDGVPKTYKFLPSSELVTSKAPDEEFDLLITVDSSDLTRIGKQKILAKKIINIDHHPDNTNYGDINYVELLSSVAEQIFKLANFLGIGIDKEIATALYISIITDTGNFRYANTLPSTFEIAHSLVDLGADPYRCSNLVYETKSFASLKILALALLATETRNDGKIVFSFVTLKMLEEAQAKKDDAVGVIDHLRSVESAEVAILMREESENKFKVNFRSKGAVNVSKIAKSLGGGGHILAAGCALDGNLEEVKNKVLALVLKEF